MKGETESGGWKRDKGSLVDKMWAGAMWFIAFSVMTCVMPLLPERTSSTVDDGIMVREVGSESPRVAFMKIESGSIFSRLSKPSGGAVPIAKIPLDSSELSIAEQLKDLSPAQIALPAALNRFWIADGEIKQRPRRSL